MNQSSLEKKRSLVAITREEFLKRTDARVNSILILAANHEGNRQGGYV